MTGAAPSTGWLDGCVALDPKGFIKTGSGPHAGRSRCCPLAAGAAAVPARNEPARRVRRRRRARRQRQAGGVGGRRRIDGRLRSSTRRCSSEGGNHARRRLCSYRRDHDGAAGQAPRVRGVHQDRRALGAPAHVSAMWCDALLRQLPQPPREQARARDHASGHRVRRTRRALVVLLPGRGVCRSYRSRRAQPRTTTAAKRPVSAAGSRNRLRLGARIS